ncbi:MAG: PAS domain S-box protein [Deltaproteobacteria bacterium]|nr:PAS domain S-box protein [Deltaproteobacteria bacterium]
MKTKNSNTHPKQIRDIKCAIQDYAAVLDSVNDAIFMYESNEPGPPGKFIYVNDAALELTEYSRAELMELTPVDITAALSIDDFKLLRSEFIKTGRLMKEVMFETKTGRKIPAEINVRRTNIEGRNVGLTVARNITDRLEAKAKLRETEDKYRTHFEYINDVILSIDADFRVTSVSPSIEKHLGYTPDEFVGKYVHDCLHVFQPESLNRAIHNISRLLSGEKLPVNSYGFLTKDGKEVFAEIQGTPLIRDGKVTGLVSVVRNITERKEAENGLKESELRYRHLINHVPVGIVEVDVVNDRFIDVNDVICSYVEYSRDELLSMKVSSLFTEESVKVMHQRIRAFSRGENLPADVEYKLRTKSGAIIWVLSHMRHVVKEGKLTRTTGIVYDINHRKLIEEKLRIISQKLENDLVEKTTELKSLNNESIAKKGELDRIKHEYESVRQQVIENKSALSILAKNMEHVHHETENQILLELRKILLPVMQRLRSDKRLGFFANEFDSIINYLDAKTSKHAERTRILYSLTPAELQIATQIGHEMKSEEIASYLNVSINTVKTHRKNIRKKLGLQDSKTNLVAFLKSHLP